MNDFIQRLKEQFHSIQLKESLDCFVIKTPYDTYLQICTFLKDLHFNMLMDLTAVDNGIDHSPRFTLFSHFFSTFHKSYIRVSCDCIEDKKPQFPSVSHLYPAANWHERETFDMFGIIFLNHPDLKRILMWDTYPYFPLRKDFPLAGIETNLPAEDVAQITRQKVNPAPMMGGPFCSKSQGFSSQSEPAALDQSWTEKSIKN